MRLARLQGVVYPQPNEGLEFEAVQLLDRHPVGAENSSAAREKGRTLRPGMPDVVFRRTQRSLGQEGLESATCPLLKSPKNRTWRLRSPDEVLRRARPFPPRDQVVMKDVPDQEWQAFQDPLAET